MEIKATLSIETTTLSAQLHASGDTQLNASFNASVTAGDSFSLGHALGWDSQGRLAVQVATSAEADNTLPITAAAVQTELGNITVLLGTI